MVRNIYLDKLAAGLFENTSCKQNEIFLMIISYPFFSRGTFRFERQDGSTIDVRIPPFSLESKEHHSEK